MFARAAVVVAVFLLVPVAAQGGDAPSGPFEAGDAADDHRMTVEGQAVPPPARFTHMDLVSLRMEETKHSVLVTLRLQELPPEGVIFVEAAIYELSFVHNDQPFRILFYRVYADQVYHWANLERLNAQDDDYNWVAFLPVTVDRSAGTLSVEVLREDLRDRQGAAPFPGRELTDIHVTSTLRNSEGLINVGIAQLGMGFNVQDRLPDEGFATETLRFQQGLQNSGHAVLWSDSPMRASNGEATTFVYTLTAQNEGAETDVFDLKAQGAPPSWHVSLPQQRIELEAGEAKEVPVIVATPFAHQHGSEQTFRVTMTSRNDPGSVGRVELGIRYHEVPQPAGHHDEVWFHSVRYGEENALFVLTDTLFSGNGGFTYFNTQQEDEADQKVPVGGDWWGYGNWGDGITNRWGWFVVLNPALEMGLDFDRTRTGTLSVPLTTQVPIAQATVWGTLWHLAYDEAANEWQRTELAPLERTEPFEFLPGETRTITWDIVPTEAAELVPYQKRAHLVYQFFLETPKPGLFTGAEAPRLEPGGYSKLPLLEYRDPVQDQFLAHTYLHFTAPASDAANPGTTRILKGSLHNGDDAPVAYTITVEGVNSDWARLLVPPTGTLAPGATLEIPVAVAVPGEAVSGEAADLVVSFARQDDPTVRAIGRYYVAVDPSNDLPDDADKAVFDAASKESPAPAAPLLLVAIAGLALATRTRTRRS